VKSVRLYAIVIFFFLAFVGPVPGQNTGLFDSSGLNTEERILIASLEIYISYLGDPITDWFELSDGSGSRKLYSEKRERALLGRDIISVMVENGVVEECEVLRVYKDEMDFYVWFFHYVSLIERQGFRRIEPRNGNPTYNKENIFISFNRLEEEEELSAGYIFIYR
jgi:hypothetical protein